MKLVEVVEETRDDKLEVAEMEDRFFVVNEEIKLTKEEKSFLNLGLKFRLYTCM